MGALRATVRNRKAAIAALVLACGAGPAHAHAVIQGLNGFQGGLVHPVLVPTHALSLVALGLLVGQQRKAHRTPLILGFAAALALAIAFIAAAYSFETNAVILAVALVSGLAVAVGRPLPLIATVIPVAVGAFAIEFDSVPQLVSHKETLIVLAGTAIGAWLALTTVAGLTIDLKYAWMRIGVRVVGSWSAAIALLVLALQFAR